MSELTRSIPCLLRDIDLSAWNRRTQAALEMWREMGDKASTPSTVVRTKVAKKGEDDRPSALSTEPEECPAAPAPALTPAAVVAAK